MRTRFWLPLLLALLSACSSKFESDALGLSWQPPSGVKLESEQAGPPATARFEPGVELRMVKGVLPELTEENLRRAFTDAFIAAGMPAPAKLESFKLGTIPAGTVARYTLADGGERALVYVLPLGERFLVMQLRAPESVYSRRETGFERALATLRIRAR